MLAEQTSEMIFEHGMQIGKSHTLIIREAGVRQPTVARHGQQIIASLPPGSTTRDADVVRSIRDVVIEALRIEAKSYLTKRLAYLADQGGFSYEKVRFSHASGRWGSCSSNGTISLNIALMKLPFELIDYVLIHELSHTIHMNHSQEFWSVVETVDPRYKQHRRDLKKETPSI